MLQDIDTFCDTLINLRLDYHKSEWVKYHSGYIIRGEEMGDEKYLDWMLEKAQRFGLSPVTAAEISVLCQTQESVHEAVALMDLDTLEAIGF